MNISAICIYKRAILLHNSPPNSFQKLEKVKINFSLFEGTSQLEENTVDSSQKSVLGRSVNRTAYSPMPIRTREALEAEGAHLSRDQQPPANARIPSPSGQISILTWLLRKPPLSAAWTASRRIQRAGIEACPDPRNPDSLEAKRGQRIKLGDLISTTRSEANPTRPINRIPRATPTMNSIIKVLRTTSKDLTRDLSRERCTGMTSISTTRSSRVILWARHLTSIITEDGTMGFRMGEIEREINGIFNLEGISMEIMEWTTTPRRQESNTIRITCQRISTRWKWCRVLEEVVWRLLIAAGRN